MHTARQLDSTAFAVRVGGRPATRDEVLPGWHFHDRLGVVMTEPFGAVGASHLIQLAIAAFFDLRPRLRDEVPAGHDADAIYPEIYLFHVGGRHGDHSAYDFWPARKETFVAADPRAVLDAVNDRAITRLLVPDGVPAPLEHEYTEAAAARERMRSAFAYSATGRVEAADVEIEALDLRAEENPALVLDPSKRTAALSARTDAQHPDPDLRARSWPVRTEARRAEAAEALELANARRDAIRADGLATETYRRIPVADALAMLVPGPEGTRLRGPC